MAAILLTLFSYEFSSYFDSCFTDVSPQGFKWQVIIGSGNGLVPSGTKPLPEPMMTEFPNLNVFTFFTPQMIPQT